MTKLQKILLNGTGEGLDALGKLIDLHRKGYGPTHSEPDGYYRARLASHPLIVLAGLATEQAP
jgi:hypothetical protein